MQNGLDLSTREQRLALFGPNVIDIEEKSVPTLLVEEACCFILICSNCLSMEYDNLGYPPFLRVPNRQYRFMVFG